MKAAIVNSPVDFTITEGVRALKRQQELYAQGRTKPGIKVTNADGIKNKSNHQAKADGFGHAVDLYPFFLGQVQVNHKDTIKNLKLIADHIKKTAKELGIGITWGGDWKFVDCPHFELK
ncbi:M15 family metallopeptidase [Elizabethkingia anophelis]|uniref:M15 family metallopeptidase n=1 Tax=Elizabethkingia anophelis TaxID=1117645 RepID=UPI003891525E